MEIRKGMQVVTPNDQKIGNVKNIVMTPQGGTVTHLVIERGFMFTEERVMPMSWVASINEHGHIVLADDHYDFKQLPEFKETYYVPADNNDPTAQESAAFYYYGAPGNPPLQYGQGVMPAAVYTPRYTAKTVENIPADSIALKIGAKVVSWDDQHIGNIESVLTDAEDNISHFVISQGVLLKTRRLVPTAWIERVDETAVYLGVTGGLLERLPEYEVTR